MSRLLKVIANECVAQPEGYHINLQNLTMFTLINCAHEICSLYHIAT